MTDIQECMANEAPAKVEVVQHGAVAHVFMRRNVEKDVADNGPDGEPRGFWRFEQLHYCEAGTPDPAAIEDDFDAIWAAKVAEMRTDSERIADVEHATQANGASIEDAFQAIAELADVVVGGDE